MKILLPNRYISFLNQILCSKWMILYLFLCGLLVRFIVGCWVTGGFDSDYAIIARNFAQGAGYSLDGIHPTAWRTPGYPLILAALIALFGEQKIPLIILTAVVGAINASLCCWLGIKIFRRSVGLIAGILYIFIPYLAQKEATTNGGLITLGLLIALCLLWKGWKNKNFIYIGFSGLWFAFSYLVSPTIGLIPVFISLILLLGLRKNKNIRWHLVSAIILMLAFAIGIFPWAARNYKVFKRLYIAQTFFWYDVYTGNHPRTFQIYPYLSLDNFVFIVPIKNPPRYTNEFERESWFRQLALAEICKFNPKEILSRGWRRFLYLWNLRMIPYTDRVGNDPLTGHTLDSKRSLTKNLAFSIPYLFLIIFALIGCWQERKRLWLLLFTVGFLFTFSIPYIVAVAYSKYTTQVYFVLILLAARGLAYILN